MRLGRSPLVALAVLGTSASLQASPAPQTITLADSGKSFSLRKGAQVELRLPERFRWSGPHVRGAAVRLTRILFIRDPGYLAWSLSAGARGTARVTATGHGEVATRGCDPGPCAPHLLVLTFVVR